MSMRHILVPSLLLAVAAACATSQPASNSTAAATPAPVTSSDAGPAAAVDPVGVADAGATPSQPATGVEAPPAGPAAGARVSLDQRGAFSPVLISHLDIFPDGSATCFRRKAMQPDERAKLQLTKEQLASVDEALAKDGTATARAVKRQGIIQDIGTLTLSVLKDGGPVLLVVDGHSNTDPVQANVTVLLNMLLQQCVEKGSKL